MHGRILLLAAVLTMLLLTGQGWSQRLPNVPVRPGEVRGQLRLPDGHMAPVGMPVTLMHREGDMVAQSQTDSSGKFQFTQVQPGIYRVEVRAMGYVTIETGDLDLNLQQMVYLSLELKPDPNYRNPFATAAPGGVISAESLNAPDEARKNLASGEALLEKGGDYGKSIEFFKSAIKGYPKYSEAYLMMGVAYRAQARYDEAAAALQKCIEINPNSAPAYTSLGEIQNEKKDYAAAEKNLLKALALKPDSPQAHVELARTYWALGRWQEADPHVAKALQLSPEDASAHLIMGNIDLRKRDGQGALQQFQAYLRLAPQGTFAPNVRDLVAKLEKALGQTQSHSQ